MGFRMLKSLVVLHCQLDSKNKLSSIFASLEKNLFCFRPVTCVRQILIFHNLTVEEEKVLTSFAEKITPKTEQCEIFRGYDAYEFLLTWSVGLLNSRYNYNDRFVLGTCRETWTTFCKENADQLRDHPFLKIMPLLFNDATRIRKIIEKDLTLLAAEQRITETNSLCSNHRKIRERDDNVGPLKFLYSFWNADESALTFAERQKKIAVLSKKIQHLQEEMDKEKSSKLIEPNPENKKAKALLTITQSAITACWAKRQLEKMEEPVENPVLS